VETSFEAYSRYRRIITIGWLLTQAMVYYSGQSRLEPKGTVQVERVNVQVITPKKVVGTMLALFYCWQAYTRIERISERKARLAKLKLKQAVQKLRQQ